MNEEIKALTALEVWIEAYLKVECQLKNSMEAIVGSKKTPLDNLEKSIKKTEALDFRAQKAQSAEEESKITRMR